MRRISALVLASALLLPGCSPSEGPAPGNQTGASASSPGTAKVVEGTTAALTEHMAGSAPILVDFYADW